MGYGTDHAATTATGSPDNITKSGFYRSQENSNTSIGGHSALLHIADSGKADGYTSAAIIYK